MNAFDIDDEFEQFMRKANPSVPETAAQYFESRRVFYAGVTALFAHMCELTAQPDDVGMKSIDDVKTQLEKFFKKRVGFSD